MNANMPIRTQQALRSLAVGDFFHAQFTQWHESTGRTVIRFLFVAATCFSWGAVAVAGHPDCAGVERWPTSMAFVHLKNAGLTSNDKLDFSETKTVRLASEQIEKDLYRQIHLVVFAEKSGETIEVITESDASTEECSMSDVEGFVVSRRLGGR